MDGWTERDRLSRRGFEFMTLPQRYEHSKKKKKKRIYTYTKEKPPCGNPQDNPVASYEAAPALRHRFSNSISSSQTALLQAL